jgi:integrase
VTIEQVYALAGEVSAWFSALVLLAAFTGLRWGELISLRRRHLDLDGDGVVKVRGSVAEVYGKFIEGPPRSAGNMLAAEIASLRELMTRMGHSSTRAALIYQHASRDRERAIAAAVSARVEAARPKVEGHDRGTATDTAPKRASDQKRRKRP